MNPVLLPVTDKSLKENIDNILLLRSKLATVDAKIDTQNKEILKTVDIIEKFKTCYNQQTEALQKFNEERSIIFDEYRAVLQDVQGKSDEISIHIKSEFDFIGEKKVAENLSEDIQNCFSSVLISDSTVVNSQDVHYLSPDVTKDRNKTPSVDCAMFDDREASHAPLVVSGTATSATQIAEESAKKKLKRKCSSSDLFKSKSLKKKSKFLMESKKLKKKKKKFESTNQEAIVMMKVDTCPIKRLISLEQHQHSVIHKIVRVNSDLFVCGSDGLLACRLKSGVIISYRGHECRPVRNFYALMGINKYLVSLNQDSVLVHSISDASGFRCLTRFESDICGSCVYKSKIYGCLGDGKLFMVDMVTEKVTMMDKGSRDRLVNMVVVKANGSKLMIASSSGSEIIAYRLDDKLGLLQRPALKVSGDAQHSWQGIVTYSSSVICYTRHAIFLLDKVGWTISLIKEITNDIHFLDADMHNIVVLDNYNILHKYIIKKGKIRLGSTIEYLKSVEKPTAMLYNHSAKKIYFGIGHHLFNQNF